MADADRMVNYEEELRKAKSISDIFEIVKNIVNTYLGLEQAGLLVGIADLGGHSQGFVGAFYSLNANTIIINKRPLKRISQTSPSLYNYYLFHVMLHEYIHAIGSFDEVQTRMLVSEISEHYFGTGHIVTQFATSMEKFIPNLTYPIQGFQEPEDMGIEFVKGIDKKNLTYIN